jgi:hypothetical protein
MDTSQFTTECDNIYIGLTMWQQAREDDDVDIHKLDCYIMYLDRCGYKYL